MGSSDQMVQCVNCGFLAKFDRHFDGPPPYIYEMPPKDRETGIMSSIHLSAKNVDITFPQCYVNAISIWTETEAAKREGMGMETAARTAFNRPRSCDKWHQYTHGFSPQDHLQEERVRALELERRTFELRSYRLICLSNS